MNTKISVPKSCNEDWEKMQTNKNGRFCNVCNLTVVDFSIMTELQIQKYLADKSYVCGRFNYTQVDTRNKIDLLDEKNRNIFYTLFKYILLLLLGIPIFISSCINHSKKDDKIDNQIDTSRIDKAKHLMGAVAMPRKK